MANAMDADEVRVLFYGLFMDESLLASKGIRSSNATVGYVDAYGLRTGNRATQAPEEGHRVHGALMTLRADHVNALYSEDGVADYVPERVCVVLLDGRTESAVCYNLPRHELGGANPDYAQSLLKLAGTLGLPETYLQEIREQIA